MEGDIALLSRAITLIESTKPAHQQLAQQLLDELLPFTGNSVRIGITGVPGVGKSTFIEAFGMYMVNEGHKVAVLAIDPSSSRSKGAILGDKTRMEQLSVHPNAFIRPTAAGHSLGGVAYRTREATLLCEAAGFTHIIIETVGVGQSETEVFHMTDFFLLLMLAGAGDELQGIKRGIMEMADTLVITKADGDNLQKAKAARSEYARALHFLQAPASGWSPKVLLSSAFDGNGINEVAEEVEKFVRHQKANGHFALRRKHQNLRAFSQMLSESLLQQFLEKPAIAAKIKTLEAAVLESKLSPYSAVKELLHLL